MMSLCRHMQRQQRQRLLLPIFFEFVKLLVHKHSSEVSDVVGCWYKPAVLIPGRM
jgi:hypothetical protein